MEIEGWGDPAALSGAGSRYRKPGIFAGNPSGKGTLPMKLTSHKRKLDDKLHRIVDSFRWTDPPETPPGADLCPLIHPLFMLIQMARREV